MGDYSTNTLQTILHQQSSVVPPVIPLYYSTELLCRCSYHLFKSEWQHVSIEASNTKLKDSKYGSYNSQHESWNRSPAITKPICSCRRNIALMINAAIMARYLHNNDSATHTVTGSNIQLQRAQCVQSSMILSVPVNQNSMAQYTNQCTAYSRLFMTSTRRVPRQKGWQYYLQPLAVSIVQ